MDNGITGHTAQPGRHGRPGRGIRVAIALGATLATASVVAGAALATPSAIVRADERAATVTLDAPTTAPDLRIRADYGDVVVMAGGVSDPEIEHVPDDASSDNVGQVSGYDDSGTYTVELRHDGRHPDPDYGTLTVIVPRTGIESLAVDITGVGDVDVDLHDVADGPDLDVDVPIGDVSVEGSAHEVAVSAATGDVTLADLSAGGAVSATSSAGDVDVALTDQQAPTAVTATSDLGDVQLELPGAIRGWDVSAKSTLGTVDDSVGHATGVVAGSTPTGPDAAGSDGSGSDASASDSSASGTSTSAAGIIPVEATSRAGDVEVSLG